ncbi:MAG: hypothetical protein ABI432_10250, partial [Flavobacteriales bacterium]
MTHRVAFVFVILLCGPVAMAQDQHRIDSLLIELKGLGQDTTRLRTLAALSMAYAEDAKADAVDNEIIALAAVLGASPHGAVQRVAWRAEADATLRGSSRKNPGGAATSAMLPDYRHALELYKRSGDPRLQAYALTGIAAVHYNQGDAATWMRLTQEAIALRLSVGDSSQLLGSWSMFSAILLGRGEYDQALAYSRQGLAYSERIGRPVLVLKATSDIAETYFERGDLDSAAIWNDRARAMAKEQGIPAFEALTITLQGRMAEQQGHLRMALDLYAAADSTDAADQSNAIDSAFTAETRSDRAVRDGRLRFKLGEIPAALALGKEALRLARSTGFPSTVEPAAALLRDVYLKLDRPGDALAMWQLQVAMRDSLNSQEAAESILRFQFRQTQLTDSVRNANERERDQEQARDAVQRQRNQRNVLLGFGAFGLVFAVVDYRRRRRIKAEHARSEALLLNILPEEVAEELKAKGHAD